MFTRFYDNTIITKFINNVIAKTNIPTISYLLPGDTIQPRKLYIYKNGIYESSVEDPKQTGHFLTVVVEPGASDDSIEKYLKYKSPYLIDSPYKNITTNYICASTEYSPETHYYLGEYLRFVRGAYGINLMPFYNCFNGVYLYSVDLETSKVAGRNNTRINFAERNVEDGYKIVSVPIKFDKQYSVYIDSEAGFDYCPVMFGKNTIIEDSTNALLEVNDFFSSTYTRCRHSEFKKPFIIEKIKSFSDTYVLSQYEKCLRLLIKIPDSNNSSIVVLEGDYSDISKRVLGNNQDYLTHKTIHASKKNSEVTTNYQLISPLKLTWVNDGYTYGFTNTLPQYLLLNVISSADSIDQNIQRVQEYVSSEQHKRIFGTILNRLPSGQWDDTLRDYLFTLMLENPNTQVYPKLDIVGYVDKLTEREITRGQTI